MQDVATDRPVVLVVDDVPDTVELYADMLGEEYEVRTANSGEEALSMLDDEVDVVLLDRRMPGLTGYEVVDAIGDRDVDAHIAMVTATEPDFDIADVAFDEYVTKPVSVDELRGVVADLVARSEYDRGIRRYFALASKAAALESSKTEEELAANEAYADLRAELAELRAELDDALDDIAHDHPGDPFEDLF